MKSYIDRIRELREDRDITQKEIAAVLQTTQQVYSRYEQGVNEIPLHHFIALADFYGVSLDYLAGKSDKA